MPSDASAVELAGASGEQMLGLLLDRRLALWVGLGGVPHVGERDLGASVREQPPEGKRIAVVAGTVVGNDYLRHGQSPDRSWLCGRTGLSGARPA